VQISDTGTFENRCKYNPNTDPNHNPNSDPKSNPSLVLILTLKRTIILSLSLNPSDSGP